MIMIGSVTATAAMSPKGFLNKFKYSLPFAVDRMMSALSTSYMSPEL